MQVYMSVLAGAEQLLDGSKRRLEGRAEGTDAKLCCGAILLGRDASEHAIGIQQPPEAGQLCIERCLAQRPRERCRRSRVCRQAPGPAPPL